MAKSSGSKSQKGSQGKVVWKGKNNPQKGSQKSLAKGK